MEGVRKYSGHAASLEHRADVAREWAVYFSALTAPEYRSQTVAYFVGAADLMQARAERLRRPAWRAVPEIIAGVTRGEYSSRTARGFGWRALLQDLYHFYYVGTHHG
jgi:hypothetical protein